VVPAEEQETVVWTDGSCNANGMKGRGGWAALIAEKPTPREISGSEDGTTHNRMELTAVCEALETLTGVLEVRTDSRYVERCFNNKWYERWLRDGDWKGSSGPVKNRDLWERLFGLVWDGNRDVRFVWIKGHAGDVNNARVDHLAREAAVSHRRQQGVVSSNRDRIGYILAATSRSSTDSSGLGAHKPAETRDWCPDDIPQAMHVWSQMASGPRRLLEILMDAPGALLWSELAAVLRPGAGNDTVFGSFGNPAKLAKEVGRRHIVKSRGTPMGNTYFVEPTVKKLFQEIQRSLRRLLQLADPTRRNAVERRFTPIWRNLVFPSAPRKKEFATGKARGGTRLGCCGWLRNRDWRLVWLSIPEVAFVQEDDRRRRWSCADCAGAYSPRGRGRRHQGLSGCGAGTP
jgi:ribonuclease HI